MPRPIAYLDIAHHKQGKKDSPLYPVWTVAKFWGHGGYDWYLVMDDGELLCAACVRANYRQIVRDTRDGQNTGWRAVNWTHSGEMDASEPCAYCYRDLGPEQE